MDDFKVCAVCGKTFEKPRTVSRAVWAERRFCSRKCFGAAIAKAPLPKDCAQCGHSFTKPPALTVKQWETRRFCSAACSYEGRKGTKMGADHHAWKGGRAMHPQGYVNVRIPDDHPYAGMRRNAHYVLEHRLVMAEHLGRALRPDETVHHRNGRRDDNRIENLELRSGRHGKGAAMCCARCGSTDLVPIG